LKLRLMRAVLARTQERCDASGVPLLLVVLPSRVDLCDDLEFAWVDRERWPASRPRELTEAFIRIADELRIPYLDLFPHFADDPCRLYLRGGDSHWNEAGQALAARLVADRIRPGLLLER
ncbi:MAG: hypothetical protein H0V12_04495, partial [Chloroflexi bacterium]|nr:hypothetical protein [Chloroflexota bacterium]